MSSGMRYSCLKTGLFNQQCSRSAWVCSGNGKMTGTYSTPCGYQTTVQSVQRMNGLRQRSVQRMDGLRQRMYSTPCGYQTTNGLRQRSVQRMNGLRQRMYSTPCGYQTTVQRAYSACGLGQSSQRTYSTREFKDYKLPGFVHLLRDPNNEEQASFFKDYDFEFIPDDKMYPEEFKWEKMMMSNEAIGFDNIDGLGQNNQDPAAYNLYKSIPSPDRKLLTQEGRQFIKIAKGYYFADYRDSPVSFAASARSYIWIDPNAKQEKILFQMNKSVPPLLWIPLKPHFKSIHRLIKELHRCDAVGIESCHEIMNEMLKSVDIHDKSKNQERDAFKFINDIHPDKIVDPHPNNCLLYLGNTDQMDNVEQSFMNNPFVFRTPVLLGTSNKHTRSEPIITSKFRTVHSRSVLTFYGRYDLHSELASPNEDSKWNLPLFVNINYPDNNRFSKPIARRINKVFGTNYPENTPVDVLGALLGYKALNHRGIRSFIKDLKQEEVPPQYLAHLGILEDPDYLDICLRYEHSPDPARRIAVVRGAKSLNWNHITNRMIARENNKDVRLIMERCVETPNNQ